METDYDNASTVNERMRNPIFVPQPPRFVKQNLLFLASSRSVDKAHAKAPRRKKDWLQKIVTVFGFSGMV